MGTVLTLSVWKSIPRPRLLCLQLRSVVFTEEELELPVVVFSTTVRKPPAEVIIAGGQDGNLHPYRALLDPPRVVRHELEVVAHAGPTTRRPRVRAWHLGSSWELEPKSLAPKTDEKGTWQLHSAALRCVRPLRVLYIYIYIYRVCVCISLHMLIQLLAFIYFSYIFAYITYL